MTDWDDVAGEWDGDEAVRAYAASAFASLESIAATVGFGIAGSVVCDFGCGTGLLTERLVGTCDRIDAVDTSPAMRSVVAAKVAARGWTSVSVGEDVAGGPYDLVVASSVLGFVDHYEATVHSLVASMAPGGLFVQWDWEADPGEEGLTRERVRAGLTAAGLVDVTVDSAFSVEVEGFEMQPLVGCGRRPG